MATLMNKHRTISCNANCSLRLATSDAWSMESDRMTVKSPEPDPTATSESTVGVGVGTCEVGEFDLALPFPFLDNYK